MQVPDEVIRSAILAAVGAHKSVAPRDIAQKISLEGEDWRRYLPRIRQVATKLYDDGLLLFIRKKKVVSPHLLKGVYRFSKPES